MMKKIVFILSCLPGLPVQAEVFKCQLDAEKTIYQSSPCQPEAKQEIIDIKKPDPRKIAEAEAKLKAWNENLAQREAATIEAEKQRQIERNRQTSVEALQNTAEYQRRQAYEAKRQADALERQNRRPVYQSYPLYPYPGPHQPQPHDGSPSADKQKRHFSRNPQNNSTVPIK